MKRFLLAFLLCFLTLGSVAQIPSVTLRNLEGKSVRTDTISNNGKPFAFMFFASWCKPCNRELDNVSEVYDDWREELGIKIYAISIDEGQNVQKVKPFVDNHGWEYEILLDSNSDFRRSLGINMIPHTLVFDGSGKMIITHSGYQEGSENRLFEEIKKELDK